MDGVNQQVVSTVSDKGGGSAEKKKSTLSLQLSHKTANQTLESPLGIRKVTVCDVTHSVSDCGEKVKGCIEKLKEKNFPDLEVEGKTEKPTFCTACEYLNDALYIVENHPSLTIKMGWMGRIAQFVGCQMGIAQLSQNKRRGVKPYIERVQLQMQSLFQVMEAELHVAEAKQYKSQWLPHPESERGKWYSDLAIFLSDLHWEVSAYESQSSTAWSMKQYYEALSESHYQKIEKPVAQIYVHVSKVALIDICNKAFKFGKRELPLSQDVNDKARAWLNELDQYGDINGQSFYKHLKAIALAGEHGTTLMGLNETDAVIIYYRLTRTYCRLATLNPPKAHSWMFEKDASLFGEMENDVIFHEDRKKKQKERIQQAYHYMNYVRELGIDKKRQAELHFYFVFMIEMGNVQEQKMDALSHMREGACLGRSGMHHLYLLNCFNHATPFYPKNYGRPFCEWLRVQRDPETLQQGLPEYSHEYCSAILRGMLHFMVFGEEGLQEGIDSGLFVIEEEEKTLGCTFKKIAKKSYVEALADLEVQQGLSTISDDATDYLAGYCCEQLISADDQYLGRALKNYESAYDGDYGAKCTGLDYGRLAVQHMTRLKEDVLLKAEKLLEGAADYFRKNELLDEFEESHLLLDFLGDRQGDVLLEDVCTQGAPPDITSAKTGKLEKKRHRKPRKNHRSQPSNPVSNLLPSLTDTYQGGAIAQALPYSDESGSDDESASPDSEVNVMGNRMVLCETREGVLQASVKDSVQLLNNAHYKICIYDFDEAEKLLHNIEHCGDRRLKGRIAHMKCWCFRQRYRHNVPGSHVQSSNKKTMINLLSKAEREAKAGLRHMGVKGTVENCSCQSVIALSFDFYEKRTLASLFAELGHIYRDLSGFQSTSENNKRLGESMSNLADQLNPTRRTRPSAVSVEHKSRVRVISRKKFERIKKSLDSQNT